MASVTLIFISFILLGYVIGAQLVKISKSILVDNIFDKIIIGNILSFSLVFVIYCFDPNISFIFSFETIFVFFIILFILSAKQIWIDSHRIISKLSLEVTAIFLCYMMVVAFYLFLPSSNGDSIDYHSGLYFKDMSDPFNQFWLSGRMSRLGEFFNYFLKNNGAENYLIFLQFTCLAALAHRISKSTLKSSNLNINIYYLLLSSPILLQLSGSLKPQILPMYCFVTGVCLVFRSRHMSQFLFGAMLLGMSPFFKFNYLIWVGLVLLITLIFGKKIKGFSLYGSLLIGAAVSSGYLAMLINIASIDNVFDLLSPINDHSDVSDQLSNYLRRYDESKLLFPISLIVPDRVGNISTVLGVAGILVGLGTWCWVSTASKVLALKSDGLEKFTLAPEKVLIILMSIVLIGLGIWSSRFYFLLAILMLSFHRQFNLENFLNNWLTLWLFRMQAVAVFLCFMVLPFLYFFEGSLSWKNKVIYGYQVAELTKKQLPVDNRVLISERFMSHFDGKAISTDFINILGTKSKEMKTFAEELNLNGVKYALVKIPSPTHTLLKSCDQEVLKTMSTNLGTRNPFNVGRENFRLIRILENWECIIR